MKIILKEIADKNIWNNFVLENKFEFYSFLCSWEWADLQNLAGKKVFRYGIYKLKSKDGKLKSYGEMKGDNTTGETTFSEGQDSQVFNSDEEDEELIGLLPLIKNKAKRGIYLFAPHTPLIKTSYMTSKIPSSSDEVTNGVFFEVLENILPELKKKALEEKAVFVRFDPPIKNLKENKNAFKKLGFINAPMHEHAEDTHLLDLTPDEVTLFLNIKKDDRYYINRAIKEGVKIEIGNSVKQMDMLIKMHENHSKKIGYHAFSREFIKYLYQVFGKDISTVSASYNGIVESILMTIKFGQVCVYYIAASDIKNSKFSPNYLCQWEAIKKAKNDGCTIYNFWGVSPDNNSKHPIAGVSKFKRRFSGYDYSLLHAQDLPLTFKYRFNYLVETIRRKNRGYYYKKPE